MGDANRLPDDYDVPAFHPFATENEALRWDFYVRHYERPGATGAATRSTRSDEQSTASSTRAPGPSAAAPHTMR